MPRLMYATLAFVLAGCTDTVLVGRITQLEANQGQIVQAINALAAMKVDKPAPVPTAAPTTAPPASPSPVAK